jgi:hypothetical protein
MEVIILWEVTVLLQVTPGVLDFFSGSVYEHADLEGRNLDGNLFQSSLTRCPYFQTGKEIYVTVVLDKGSNMLFIARNKCWDQWLKVADSRVGPRIRVNSFILSSMQS